MPWNECHVIDERLRFVARLLEGERSTLTRPIASDTEGPEEYPV